MAAASSAETTRLHAIRRHLASAQWVERGRGDAGVRRSEGTSRGRSGVRRRVGVIAQVVVHARGVKVQERRRVGHWSVRLGLYIRAETVRRVLTVHGDGVRRLRVVQVRLHRGHVVLEVCVVFHEGAAGVLEESRIH